MCLKASSGVPEMTPVLLSRSSPFGRSGITVNRSIPPLLGALMAPVVPSPPNGERKLVIGVEEDDRGVVELVQWVAYPVLVVILGTLDDVQGVCSAGYLERVIPTVPVVIRV